MPGGNPVTALSGETPTLPVMTVGPVLVIACDARTEYVCAVPRVICAIAEPANIAVMPMTLSNRACFRFIWISLSG
jgi:hypothetical protein